MRNSNIEILRFILMIFICIWHMCVIGGKLNEMGYDGIMPKYSDLLIMAICVPAVNCFMLISGYYGIKMSLIKIIKFIFQATIIYYSFIIANYLITHSWGFDSFVDFIKLCLPISSRQWWFLSEYFVILLLSPIINKGISAISKRDITLCLIVLFSFNSIGRYISNMYGGYDLVSLLNLYLLGRYLSMYYPTITKVKSLCIWGIPFILLLSLLFLIHAHGNIDWMCWTILFYCNPLIIIMAIGILYFVLSFKVRHSKCFLWIGKHCFAIYLISGPFIGLYDFWRAEWLINPLFGLIYIFLFAIFCFIIDFIIDIMFERLLSVRTMFVQNR